MHQRLRIVGSHCTRPVRLLLEEDRGTVTDAEVSRESGGTQMRLDYGSLLQWFGQVVEQVLR